MRLLSGETQFDFMGKRRVALMISVVLLVVSVLSLAIRGLQLGIDFTGGTLIEVGYEQPADIDKVRRTLSDSGFVDAVTQHFGTSRDVLVRIAPREGATQAQVGNEVLAALRAGDAGKVDLRRVEFVGPQVGEELTEDGGLAMLIALFAIFIYVMFRFEWKFSAGAVAALFHDVLITLGMFSLFALDFDLTVLAAVLAVIGYSLNDTIVVFDRMRENFRRMRRVDSIQVINASLNQTLSRTLMTSLTTLLVLIALFIVGGELIHGFATALIIGVVIGTYS
ncbi:MAG: preprotein translocase subunit SecF, partial [Gammaproteobacteria bacterium]